MTFQFQDRVQETTTTTGTGTITLAGAVVGFQSFSSVMATGDTCYYVLQAVNGSGAPTGAWEQGIGTYTTSGNTLARTYVLASSNSNAAISLSGTTQVWIDMPSAFPKSLPVNAKQFGAKGNTRMISDGVSTASSTTFTSATAAFTAADVGKNIDLATTNGSGVATLIKATTIAGYTNATTVTLAAAPTTSATSITAVIGTDDSTALTAFINFLNSAWPVKGEIPAGVYFCNTTLPAITRPITLSGHGVRASIIQFGASVSGQCLTLLNDGFGGENVDVPQTGNVAFNYSPGVLAGVTLRDFTIQGNRACASLQHGLVLQGDVDWLDVSHIDCLYFRGCGVMWQYTGTGGTKSNALTREGNMNTMKLRHCGDFSTNTPSWAIYLDDDPGNPGDDSTNLFNISNVDVVFSYGVGFAVQDRRSTTSDGSPIYGLQVKNLMLHERFAASGPSAGRLFSVSGAVLTCNFEVAFAYCSNNDYCVEILPSASQPSILYPYDNSFTFDMPSAMKGVTIGAVGNNNLHFRSYFGTGEAVVFTSPPNEWSIRCESDGVFQPLTAGMTLSGTSAVAASLGTVNATPNLGRFFPANNTNGTGDTMLVTIFGINGTLTRAGSIPASTDTYTFTPAASSTTAIPNGSYFSKINVNLSQGAGVAGRYKYIPENRYGMAANGTYNSGRLLELWPWQVHIEAATNLPRLSYGPPSADNSGMALAPLAGGFVGASATPSVVGLSKLTANYASATTLTNFTGGIDGQTITVIASNANCTIANNTNIHTTTGANVTMTASQVLRFTFDTTVGKWCGG